MRTRVVVGGDSGEGELDFEELVAGGTPTAPGIDVDGRDVCALMYTSGTTGRPKGVMLTLKEKLGSITPIAVVALTEDGVAAADELIAHVRERLAHFKCSTRVEFVPGLPRTATGKVLKATLRMNYGGREVPLGR